MATRLGVVGLLGPPSSTAHNPYDTDRSGSIERDEVVAVVKDYFNREITKEAIMDLIKLYFAGAG